MHYSVLGWVKNWKWWCTKKQFVFLGRAVTTLFVICMERDRFYSFYGGLYVSERSKCLVGLCTKAFRNVGGYHTISLPYLSLLGLQIITPFFPVSQVCPFFYALFSFFPFLCLFQVIHTFDVSRTPTWSVQVCGTMGTLVLWLCDLLKATVSA